MNYPKDEAEDYEKIEVWWLLKGIPKGSAVEKVITWKYKRFSNSVRCYISKILGEEYVIFSLYTKKKYYRQQVDLVTTKCNFGGHRYWFKCPLNFKNCLSRVGVLYIKRSVFGCRKCHHLTYYKQNDNRHNVYYSVFQDARINQQVKELEKNTKRYFYDGKPTKNHRKLLKLKRKLRSP